MNLLDSDVTAARQSGRQDPSPAQKVKQNMEDPGRESAAGSCVARESGRQDGSLAHLYAKAGQAKHIKNSPAPHDRESPTKYLPCCSVVIPSSSACRWMPTTHLLFPLLLLILSPSSSHDSRKDDLMIPLLQPAAQCVVTNSPTIINSI